FLLRYDRLTQRQATMEQAMLAVCDALTEAGVQLAEATAERDAQEKTVENLQRTLAQAHDALLQKTNLLHAAREKAAAAENRVHSGEETAQRLTAEGDALGARLKLIEATIAQSGGGLAEAEAQRVQAQSALAMRGDELAAANQNAQMWEDKLSAHKSAIMDRLNRAANMRAAQARQLTMQSQMTSRRQEIDQQLSDLTGREETLAQALQGAEQSLQGETLRQQALQKEAADFEQTTKTLLDGILQKQKETQEAAQQRKAVDARLHTLRELQEGYEGYQYPVKSALARARRDGDKGIHDVVAMLLTVPKELETAMDMALGGAMQNIVTQTEQDAKRMIDYLRDNRLGRATFLPLSTVRGRTLDARERAVLSLPGCLGVASELCSFDPKYRDVMESLLGRTVVAEDLESGIRIMREGRHAFRLVTLKGDVMHSGGSMTGGSIQQ
ncbi:MAG: hypothetical protein EOM69_11385, partial [Clostridia bacterium]|nr:hypothetical protein [Clostridia bacterium]